MGAQITALHMAAVIFHIHLFAKPRNNQPVLFSAQRIAIAGQRRRLAATALNAAGLLIGKAAFAHQARMLCINAVTGCEQDRQSLLTTLRLITITVGAAPGLKTFDLYRPRIH
jgi:hypothetical protein